MNKLVEQLNHLKWTDVIEDWVIVPIDSNGIVSVKGHSNNSEVLVITFNDGQTLTIKMKCSSILENLSFV